MIDFADKKYRSKFINWKKKYFVFIISGENMNKT